MSQGILIVEDEAILAKNIKRYLERHGYEVRIARTGEDGIAQFEDFKPDMVLLDFNLPGADGLEVLERIRALDSRVKVILITAHGNVRIAVDAMKAGAYDYLGKPVNLGELKLLIDKAVGQDRLEGALSYYRDRQAGGSGLDKILGGSPAIQRLKERIGQLLDAERRLAEGAPAPVLITGETGTGKELVARALHFDGARKPRPFVEINCASIPPHLVESELFGHERGAFTDARERKLGLVESAHGGTLFLDEVGDLEPAVQVKLLKLLEDKIVRRLGSVRDHKVDIRIVAATNRPLEDLIRQGKFRSDLYFRLRVVAVEVPPLRERGQDAVSIAEHFLDLHGRRYGKPRLRFSAEARAAILRQAWPGNVRELRNVVEQAVLVAPGEVIGAVHLACQPACPVAEACELKDATGDMVALLGNGGIKLAEVERGLLVQALRSAAGNVTRAAKSLGISRDTLRYRMEKYDLRPLA